MATKARLLVLVGLALAHQQAAAITLVPGSLLVLEGNKGLIKSYGYNGNHLETLTLASRIHHPMGLTVLGKSIYVLSGDGWVGRVDPITGLIFDQFMVEGNTALGDNGTNLLISPLTSNVVFEYTTSGVLVRTYSTVGPVTGLDGDPAGFFVGTYASGNVVRYNSMGAPMFTISTGVGAGSISAVGADFGDSTVWISSAFGDGKLRQFSFTGRLLRTFIGPDFVMGMDVIPKKSG